MDVVLARRSGEGIGTTPPRKTYILFLWTFARNSDKTTQKWLADLYGLWGDRAVPASKLRRRSSARARLMLERRGTAGRPM